MSEKQKLFYLTWAVAWVGLALCASVLLVTSSGGPKTLFDAEAWFVTFPVAWTVALLIVRYQERLRYFASHPSIKIVYLVGIMSWHSWSFWSRGVRNELVGFKMVGILLALMAAGTIVTLIAGAFQTWKSRAKSPSP